MEPHFYGALWFFALGLVSLLVILGWLDTAAYRGEILFVAGLLTVTMATIGWIWSGRNSIALTRCTNTLAFFNRLSGADVEAMKDVVYPYIEKYDAFHRDTEGTVQRPRMPEREIEQLLGVYEQFAIAVICGAINERMAHNAQMLVTKRIYLGLSHHISNMQRKDPAYFSEFEKLVCKWHPEFQKKAARLDPPGHLFHPTKGIDIAPR